MSITKYPETIYRLSDKAGVYATTERSTNYGKFAEHGYRTGLEDGKKFALHKSLDGYSNLTEAISNGVDIDWKQLDECKAKCVHPELGILTHKMERDKRHDLDSVDGWWWPYSFQRTWVEAFKCGWHGENGWSLWIEGEIPLNRKTADALLPGTIFKGQEKGIETRTYVVVLSEDGGTQAIEKYSTRENIDEPGSIEVIEVISGGFKDEA